MNYFIIANSISGQGKTKENVALITSALEELNLEYTLTYTKYPNHAKELAETIKKEDNTTIISMGGDGTIFEIVNGINPEVPLIIIPTGSGNDFFRIISGNKEIDFKKLIKDSINGKTTKLDLIKVVRDNIEYKCLNTTSLGVDADINDMASKFIRAEKYNKDTAYNVAILKNILHIVPKNLKITLDDKSKAVSVLLFTIMNGRYYGNGYNPTPQADLQDGLLDVVYVGKLPLISLLLALLKYKSGKTDKIKQATITKCKTIEISSDVPFNMQSDGENYSCKELKLEVLPKALTLVIPGYNNNLK